MKGLQDVIKGMKAGYEFFYIKTEEVNRIVAKLSEMISENDKEVKIWNLEDDQDPDMIFQVLDEGTAQVCIAINWQWFLKDDYGQPDKRYCTMLLNRSDLWSTIEYRKTLIIVGSDSFEDALPSPIQKLFMLVDVPLPGVEEIEEDVNYIIESAKENSKFVKPKSITPLIEASKGMTRREIKNALSYSLVKTGGKLDPLVVSEMRAKEVEKTAGLRIGKYSQTLDQLKGYDNIKTFVLKTINSSLSKGIILLGPPGTGKTTFARAIGKAVGRITFELEMAELFGGLVGDTERLVRTALEVVKANPGCILFVDEIEKGLAGSSGGSSQVTDSGTTKRAMSQFLKFLSDERPEGIYVIATCNDINSIDPEWVRPGRWDSAPWFVDLPTNEERKEIWNYYINKYKLKPGKVQDNGWSGAEIEACCRIAAMMKSTVEQASGYIVPVSKTMESTIQSLRTWAKDRTIPATKKVNGGKRNAKRKLEI